MHTRSFVKQVFGVLGLVAVVAACTPAAVAPPTAALPVLSINGAAVASTASVALGAPVTLQASEAHYTGTYTFTLSDNTIATISAAAGAASLARRPLGVHAAAVQTFTSPNGSVTLTPLKTGTVTMAITGFVTTTITITITSGTATASPSPGPTATPTAGPTATPTAGPTNTPTPTPAPNALSINPTTLNLIGVGAQFAQTATLQEAGYTGAFTIGASNCNGIATIAQSGAGGATVTVTGAAAGSCSASFSDSFNQSTTLNITVTTSSIGINSHRN